MCVLFIKRYFSLWYCVDHEMFLGYVFIPNNWWHPEHCLVWIMSFTLIVFCVDYVFHFDCLVWIMSFTLIVFSVDYVFHFDSV